MKATKPDIDAALKHLGFDTVDDLHYWAADENELNRFEALCEMLAEHRLDALEEAARDCAALLAKMAKNRRDRADEDLAGEVDCIAEQIAEIFASHQPKPEQEAR